MTHAEQDLLKLACQGDREALANLLGRVRGQLKVLARMHLDRRLQKKLDESDLVQEVLLQANNGFASFRGTTEKEFSAWLRSIMAHAAANLIRHYRGTRQRSLDLEESLRDQFDKSAQRLAHFAVAADPTPSRQVAHREQAGEVAAAIDELPEDYRDVILLHHLQGMSLPDVAEQMGRSVDSVRKLRARALIKLRNSLKE